MKTPHSKDSRHAPNLREDMEFAEELAVRYMDAHHGPRSGAFQSNEAAGQALDACLGTLFEQIGKSHNLPPSEIRDFLGRRSLAIDGAINLPFLALYALLAWVFVGQLLRRYPPEDGWVAIAITVILSSLAFGVGGLMIGDAWSGLAEGIRVGNGHLSYRVNQLPWERHPIEFFVLCVVLFWTATVTRYQIRRKHR